LKTLTPSSAAGARVGVDAPGAPAQVRGAQHRRRGACAGLLV